MDAGTKKLLIWAGVIFLFITVLLPTLQQSGGVAGVISGAVNGGGQRYAGSGGSPGVRSGFVQSCVGKPRGTPVMTPNGPGHCN
jgi:hypothetical protein